MQREQARLIDLHARLGDPLARDALLGDGLAECGARQRALAHRFQRTLREPDGAHAVMDAARPEAPLSDLEAAPFAEQDVRYRYAHILEQHFAVAVRRVVIAEHM